MRVDGASSRMDCNGKIIAERVNAERSTEERRQRERKVCHTTIFGRFLNKLLSGQAQLIRVTTNLIV